MKTSKRLEGIGEYYFSQKLREIEALNAQGRNVINLGIGSPDLPPHPEVIKVLQEASARPDTHAYQSYKGAPALRKAMSDWYRRHYNVELNPDTEILPLIGSKEGIMHICMTYLEPGDEVLVPNPGYPTYRSAVQLAGGRCVDYLLLEENDYYPDLHELASRDLSKVKLLFVNYPHMPTGQPASRASFEQLIAFAAAHDILIVHDNPYSFILNDEPQSLLGLPCAKEQVIELNSLSKSHNMAGWRIGMLCGGADRINEVLRFKSNMDSGMFLPLQLAAARALELGDEWQQELNAVYRERREKVFDLLKQLDCTFSQSQTGMFVWASIPPKYQTGFQLSDEILQRAAVFITPGGIFGSAGDAYIRVSLCAPVQRFEEALNRISHAQ
jgi:LL-diaminopimelate aminotransferase